MKNLKNIFLVSAVLFGIISIWLIPKTNGEKKTKYVRVYTEEREVPIEDKDSTKTTSRTENNREEKSEKKKTKKERVVIQRDTLDGKLERKHMKMSLFSRSRHFEPLEESYVVDSTASESDTLKVDAN